MSLRKNGYIPRHLAEPLSRRDRKIAKPFAPGTVYVDQGELTIDLNNVRDAKYRTMDADTALKKFLVLRGRQDGYAFLDTGEPIVNRGPNIHFENDTEREAFLRRLRPAITAFFDQYGDLPADDMSAPEV